MLDRVVASLDADASRDAAWDAVAAARDGQAESDPGLLIPLDDVLVRLRAELNGVLLRRAHALVVEWASLHKDELMKNWDRCQVPAPALPIEPLE